ncbi:uncharacterized protein majin isoform X2 [Brachyhypopomus gauderio]
MLDREFVSEELENAVRVVFMNLDSLQPFTTKHFNIFPYKSRWERVSELSFRRGPMKLIAYPFLITLYVETTEKVTQHTGNHANEQIPPSREDRLTSSPPTSCACEPKRRRTEQPQEGTPSQDNHSMMVKDHPQHLQQPPFLTDRAEEVLCSELHADSEMPFQPVPGAKTQMCGVQQESPESPDSESTVRDNPGVLTRLASGAWCVLSLLFSRSL